MTVMEWTAVAIALAAATLFAADGEWFAAVVVLGTCGWGWVAGYDRGMGEPRAWVSDGDLRPPSDKGHMS